LCKQPAIGWNDRHPGDVDVRKYVQERGRRDGPQAIAVATNTWEYGWQWRAACRGEDSALFFPPGDLEPKEERLARERKAKSICSSCPVRIECLEYAVRIREPHGIWGGLNEMERRMLLSRRDGRTLRSLG
jgi:WhiB family redox-sensing transcriptional regulator